MIVNTVDRGSIFWSVEGLIFFLVTWGQLNLGIYMNDTETDVSVLVDRAVGGASIADGQLEIMLHR